MSKAWFTDDTPQRFESYGWHVIPAMWTAMTPDAIDGRHSKPAKAEHRQAHADLLQDGHRHGLAQQARLGQDCHGAPLGADEIAAAREYLGWTHGPFEIPAEVYADWNAKADGELLVRRLEPALRRLPRRLPGAGRRVRAPCMAASCRQLRPRSRPPAVAAARDKAETVASRKASQNAMDALRRAVPEILGGSADLAGSNLTFVKSPACQGSCDRRRSRGNYMHYGVREFGMAAIMNGVALHGGLHPLRRHLPDLLGLRPQRHPHGRADEASADHVFTHDSIGLGEDGPTHQPVEHDRQPASDPEPGRLASG